MAEDIGTELQVYLATRSTLVAMLDKDKSGIPRIHPSVLPQSAVKNPSAVVYHLVDDMTEPTLGGVTTSHHLSNAMIQFDCYGPTPRIAARIRQQIKMAMDALNRGQANALRSSGTEHAGDRDDVSMATDGSEQHQFIRQCDYKISYQRPTGI